MQYTFAKPYLNDNRESRTSISCDLVEMFWFTNAVVIFPILKNDIKVNVHVHVYQKEFVPAMMNYFEVLLIGFEAQI